MFILLKLFCFLHIDRLNNFEVRVTDLDPVMESAGKDVCTYFDGVFGTGTREFRCTEPLFGCHIIVQRVHQMTGPLVNAPLSLCEVTVKGTGTHENEYLLFSLGEF